MIMSVLGTPKHVHPKTTTLAIKLYWCPLMKGLSWTSSTPCALSKTGQFNLYKHSRCQPLCAPWWHYGCTTSVTLQMYCPLWQYRYTNISDITDVQTSVTVRMYWLWHYSPIQMYLPQRHYILTWPTDSMTNVLTSVTLWLCWLQPHNGCPVLTSALQHYGCSDLSTSWLYWPQQHSGCTDLNIMDVLTSTFWMYWPQWPIFTDLD